MKKIKVLSVALAVTLVIGSGFSKAFDHRYYKLDDNNFIPVEDWTGRPDPCDPEPGVCVWAPLIENPENNGDFEPAPEDDGSEKFIP